MVSSPAVATFAGQNVTVDLKLPTLDGTPGPTISVFTGTINTGSANGTITGTLTYTRLPEGPSAITFRQTGSPSVEITFKEDANATVTDEEFEGNGTVTIPSSSDGNGTWTPINIYQQISVLSFLSNVIWTQKGSVEELQSNAQFIIPIAVGFIGWQVVWGPAVWKKDTSPLTGPDHVWFVAKKIDRDGTPDRYVTSVAGATTAYNLIINAAGVIDVVNFTTWTTSAAPTPASSIVATDAYISLGTAQGVHVLRSAQGPGFPKALPEYLKDAPRASVGSEFIFTGPSLGGVLSPVLALMLKRDGGTFGESDTVRAYPIAGPSPGNAVFAAAFAEQFVKTDGDGYQVWNTNIVNSLDIVPYGWSTDPNQSLRLNEIPGIYGNSPPLEAIKRTINIAQEAANKSNLTYIPLQHTILTPPSPPVPPNYEAFTATAFDQHTSGYARLFGIPLLGTAFTAAAGAEDTLFPDLINYV